MTKLLFGLLVLVCSATPCRAAGLQLSIRDGRVSIDAQEVTIRQILTEWARIGKTRIVNIERLSGGPMTIKFDDLPEKQALDIVLRTIPGYLAAPRDTFLANASVYDTILIMATTTAVAALRTTGPARPPAPQFGGFQGGMPGGGANLTQLRQGLAPNPPGSPIDFGDPAADQQDDSAMAAAAAAGLIAVPAPMTGVSSISSPMMMPGGIPQSGPSPNAPAASTPSNPWNAPPGTSQPSLAPPAAPSGTQPVMRPRPPQADR